MPKKHKKMTTVIYILIILAVAYILTGLLFYLAQPFILYFSDKKVLSTPAVLALKLKRLNTPLSIVMAMAAI
jgi:hypothetical protein